MTDVVQFVVILHDSRRNEKAKSHSDLNNTNTCVRCNPSVNITTHRTIFLSVLCGCETWSLTLREEHKLRVFENRVLRKIFGPKRDDALM